MERKTGFIILLIYLVIGLYLVNSPFQWVKIPAMISQFDKWIIPIGGVLIIIEGVKYLKSTGGY